MIATRLVPSLILVACCFLLAGCLPPGSVWVNSGARANAIIFGISGSYRLRWRPVALESFVVLRCHAVAEDAVMWNIAQGSDSVPDLSEVRYGSPIQGYREWVPPRTLAAGCYEAEFWGREYSSHGWIRFHVTTDGRIDVD